ncbi:MAG: prolyl oligopeptidase family serine peptidase [Bacteroidaceae bacterium]|nr:prolyl oligopeptidase family serine peptidase [Bacteroidaceae bacterium]
MKTFTKVFTTAILLACSSLLCSAAKFDNDVNITVGGKSRKYKLYVPNNVKQNTALVFCLHGTSGSSANRQPNFDGIADSDGIIVVYGHGESVYFPFFGMNAPGWNSTGEWSEDIDYILAIIEDVAAKYSIDRNRIYCCGFSNGGMMTYTVANLLADKFAAFASISGYPINEFHLHHTGYRPVPFLHIHGTNDDLVKSAYVSKIVDNMVARNGCNPVPKKTTVSGKYTKSVYEAGEGGFPYVFYSMNGMGHSPEVNNNTDIGNAAKTMWNFMKQYKLDDPCDPTLKFRPCIEAEGWTPKSHGWTINSNKTICAYGTGKSTDANANVYPSLQFIQGDYRLTFDAQGDAGVKVAVLLARLTAPNGSVFNDTVEVGTNRTIEFNIPQGWAEYRITFNKVNTEDNVTISNIEIHSFDPAAGISPLLTSPKGEESMYNLQGQHINSLQKGINIVNGKKILMR